MRRIERLSEFIKRELGSIIRKELDFPPTVLVTVTEVIVSPDMETAHVLISVYPDAKRKAAFGELIKRAHELQLFLNKRLKTYTAPKIVFVSDLRIAEAARVEELLETLKANKDNMSGAVAK